MSNYSIETSEIGEESEAFTATELTALAGPKKGRRPARCEVKFFKWLCFRPELDLSFTARHVFSRLCDSWFRSKERSSVAKLRKVTGCRPDAIKAAIVELEKAGILADFVPTYRAGVFYEKKSFTLKRWWTGVQSRTVTPTTGTTQRRLKGGTTKIAPGRGVGRDVVMAFVSYANARRKRITTGYLARSLGQGERTTRRLVAELVAGRRLRVTPSGLEAIVTEANGTVQTLTQHNLRRIVGYLAGCHDEDTKNKLKAAGLRYPEKFLAVLPTCQDGGRTNYQKLLNTLRKAG